MTFLPQKHFIDIVKSDKITVIQEIAKMAVFGTFWLFSGLRIDNKYQRDNLGCLTKAKFVYISVHH